MLKFSRILQEALGLQADLPEFSRWEATRRLAGLLTCPDFHANTVRIEALVHLSVALCRGGRTPTRKELAMWLNLHFAKTNLRLQEDPLEDVFISNVIDGSGNHRIFEGIWERSDYWLQSLLSICRRLPENPTYTAMRHSVAALLDLSEAIAARNELERNLAGGGDPKEDMLLPPEEELTKRADRVVFSARQLVALGIAQGDLAPFVWADTKNPEILASRLENSPLERRPILRHKDNYLVALPTALSISIRRFVLETVDQCGDLLLLDMLLNKMQASAVQGALSRLDGNPWEPKDFPQLGSHGVASLTFIPFQFDLDKFGVLMMVQPPLQNARKNGFAEFQDFRDKGKPLAKELLNLANHLASTPGFRAGLFVVALGGMGAPLAFPFPQLPPPWEFASYSVPDFLTLAGSSDVDLPMIWRLAAQQTRAESRGIKLLIPNGDFNLLAAWRMMDFTLIPAGAPTDRPGLLLALPINSLLELRQETRTAVDVHAVPRQHPRRWIEVERESPYSCFESVRQSPLYVYLAPKGELAGVVESPGVWWWVTSVQLAATPGEKSILFQIWDCIAHWLVPVSAALHRRFQPDDMIAEFQIEFPNLASWSNEARQEEFETDLPLTWKVSGRGLVTLTVTEPFFRTFMQPLNKAECEIVTALLAAGSALLDKPLAAAEIATLRDEILPLGEARYFHAIPGQDATLFAYAGPADPYHLRKEVVAEVTQELGRAIAPYRCGWATEKPDEVRPLVRGAVDHLKQQIGRQLQLLNLRHVVRRCLRVLDLVHRDQYRWKISAAALFALNEDRSELMAEANLQNNLRAGVNIAARILIETALFSCPPTGGAEVSDTALEEMLAMTQALVAIADYDLAQRAGFPVGKVTIDRNGEFHVRNEFLDQIRLEYVRTVFEAGYTATATSYAQHFARDSATIMAPEFQEFNAALTDEIALDCEQAVGVGIALHRLGMREQKSILVMKRSSLVAYLAAELKTTPATIERALQELRLYPRSAWNADLPVGCDDRDVLPWRFKRRYSLLRRPFIEVSSEPDPDLLVSPLLVGEGMRYLVNHAFVGDFPPEFFRSQRMRNFQQAAVQRRSDKFVERTAETMRKAGYTVRTELPMPDLGAPQKLGDIDVFAWRLGPNPEVLVLECKALRNARSTEEILDQLDDFRGEADDLLDRHLNRLKWLEQNSPALDPFLGKSNYTLNGLIVSTHLVPMQFLPANQHNAVFTDIEGLDRRFTPV